MNKLFFVGFSVLFLITACSNETEEEKKAKAAEEWINKSTDPTVDCTSGPNRSKSCPSFEANIPDPYSYDKPPSSEKKSINK